MELLRSIRKELDMDLCVADGCHRSKVARDGHGPFCKKHNWDNCVRDPNKSLIATLKGTRGLLYNCSRQIKERIHRMRTRGA